MCCTIPTEKSRLKSNSARPLVEEELHLCGADVAAVAGNRIAERQRFFLLRRVVHHRVASELLVVPRRAQVVDDLRQLRA